MRITNQIALFAVFTAMVLIMTAPLGSVRAEDCTGLLPDTACTLDEDTTAPLTINQNIIMTVSSGSFAPTPLVIGHTIEGKNAIEKGGIATAANGTIVHQTADIGAIRALTSITINSGDIWYLSNNADIIMDPLVSLTLNGGILGIGPSSALSTISAGILGSSNADILDFISGGQSIGTTGTIGRAGETIDLADGDDRVMYYQSAGSIIAADTLALSDGNNLFGILGDSVGSVFSGRFIGGADRDILAFFSGSSAILGSSSAQYFFGGGDDLIDFDSGTGNARGTLIVDTLDLGAGDDTITLTDQAELNVLNVFSADDGNDLITFESSGFFDATGAAFSLGDGDDILQFNSVTFVAGDTGLDVSGGAFTMGAGNDSIRFFSNGVGLNAGGTTINLGAGDDDITFLSSFGTITLIQGAGFRNIDGGTGTDSLFFGSGGTAPDVILGSTTGPANLTNIENIHLGGGTFRYVGDIDAGATILNFSSAEFWGNGTDILAAISGGGFAANVLFASSASFAGIADMGAEDDTVSFNSGATLSGTVNLEGGNDQFNFGGNSILTGMVDGGGDAGDSLTFLSGTSTITGSIINFGSGQLNTGSIVNIRDTGSVQVDLSGTGTLQYGSGGSTANTFNLTNDIDGVQLNILGDTVDTSGIALGTAAGGGSGLPLMGLSVSDGALFIVDSAIDLGDGAGGNAGILDVDGTIRLETTASISADDYDESNAGRFIFEIDRNGGVTTLGTISLEEPGQSIDFSAATGSGDIFEFVLGPISSQLVSDSVSFISAGVGGTITAPEDVNIIGDTILYDIALIDNNANAQDLELVITQLNTIAGLTDSTNNETIADVLLTDLLNNTNPGIVDLRNALLNANNATKFNEILESAQPIVDRSEVRGIDLVNRKTFGLINQRLAMLRKDTNGNTGINTGNLVEELEAWWQFYGAATEQDADDKISGYEGSTYGLATGIDHEFFEDAFFGLSFAWGETTANSRGAGDSDTEVDTYQLALYGDYDMGRAYVNGMVSYSYNDISTSKTSPAGTRTAGYHANHYSARAEIGYSFMPGKTRIIPHLMGQYSYYSPESYFEEGPAAQIITKDSTKTFDVGAGVDLSWLIKNGEGSYFVPEVNLGYRYDIANEPTLATVRYVAGGPVFEIEGYDPADQAIDLGLAMSYYSADAWDLLFRYDLEYREDYMAHAGTVRAAYKFYP